MVCFSCLWVFCSCPFLQVGGANILPATWLTCCNFKEQLVSSSCHQIVANSSVETLCSLFLRKLLQVELLLACFGEFYLPFQSFPFHYLFKNQYLNRPVVSVLCPNSGFSHPNSFCTKGTQFWWLVTAELTKELLSRKLSLAHLYE